MNDPSVTGSYGKNASFEEAALPWCLPRVAERNGLGRYLLDVRLVVAVSGGADSLALLYILNELRGDRAASTLHVAHVNHGFRDAEGDADALFVSETAGALGLPVTIMEFDVPSYAKSCGLSPEDAARRARYALLAQLSARQRCEAVAVAHTEDDQAETVLLHLLRGSGIGGLAGMKMLSSLQVGDQIDICPGVRSEKIAVTLFRPLLSVGRREILAYCARKGLEPRVDSTNSNTLYKRNLVRHKLIPFLESATPGIKKRLVRLSGLARADDDLLGEIARQAFEDIVPTGGTQAVIEFPADRFAALPDALKRRVIRLGIERLAGTLQDISMSHVENALEVFSRTSGAPTSVSLPHRITARRRAGRLLLYLGALPASPGAHESELCIWPIIETGDAVKLGTEDAIDLGCGWTITTSIVSGGADADRGNDYEALFDIDSLGGTPALRTRRAGDFIRPMGMSGRKSLQDLYVDAKIPASLRDRVALLAVSEQPGEVLWVPGRGGRRTFLAPVTAASKRVLRVQFIRGS